VAVAWVQRVPVDRINEQAQQVRFWRTVLTVIAGFLFGVGWLAAKGFAVAWLAVSWSVVAARLGWREARGPADKGGTG
jgi:uncharacterized membrane protein YedE/YeeE